MPNANVTFSFVGGVNDSVFGVSQAPIRAVIEHKAAAISRVHIPNIAHSSNRSRRSPSHHSHCRMPTRPLRHLNAGPNVSAGCLLRKRRNMRC